MSRCAICNDPECDEAFHEKPCPSCGAQLLVYSTRAWDDIKYLRDGVERIIASAVVDPDSEGTPNAICLALRILLDGDAVP